MVKEITTKGKITNIYTSNSTGGIVLVYFNNLTPFLKKTLSIGRTVSISGEVEISDYSPRIKHPEIIFKPHIATKHEPIYHLTYSITNNQLRDLIYIVLQKIKLHLMPEWLPDYVIQKYKLPSFATAIHIMHAFNDKLNNIVDTSTNNYTYDDAIRRLKIDEFISNNVAMKQMRNERLVRVGRAFTPNHNIQNHIIQHLGFDLTQCQRRVLDEIESDQRSSRAMLRLLQGDVGCGKTVIALLSAVNVVHSGGQVALVAPTEVLAKQHYTFFMKCLSDNIFADYKISVAILTGATTASERRNILYGIANGDIKIIIGTHAIFYDEVQFHDLAYVIVDEQHKFGVNQRASIIQKGDNPDVLVMSATPIPRSLVMVDCRLSQKLCMKAKFQRYYLVLRTSLIMMKKYIGYVQRSMKMMILQV
jgi:ATP-dependent DNA helicase RecG